LNDLWSYQAPYTDVDDDDGIPLGIILGAIFGSLGFLCLVCAVIFVIFLVRKRSKSSDPGSTSEVEMTNETVYDAIDPASLDPPLSSPSNSQGDSFYPKKASS